MSFSGGGEDVVVNLIAIDNMTPVLRGASAAMGAFSGSAQQMVSSLTRMGEAALPIIALGGAFIYAGQQAAMVQQNVANLNAVLHATADQLAAIRQNGLALSQATQFTDAQILQSQRQLARGGTSAGDLATGGPSGITGATLNLAGATQNSPTTAAQSLITAQQAFSLPASDAAQTATTLAQAANTSVASFAQQSTALAQAGAVARGFGKDLKETEAALVSLQNAGMVGDSGTGLRTFMTRLAAPTAAAKKELDALGVAAYDAQGKLKSVPELMDEIRNKTLGMPDDAKNEALYKVFGQRGIRTAEIAAEQGGGGVIDEQKRMIESGTAAEMNAAKLDTFQGSASKAMSSLNVLAVQLGTTFVPGMKDAADVTEALLNKMAKLDAAAPMIPNFAVAAGVIGGVSKINSLMDERRQRLQDEREKPAREAADARRAAEQEAQLALSTSTRKTEGAVDSAFAKHDSRIDAAEEQSQQQWIAMNERTDKAIIESKASTTEQLVTLQKKYDTQMAESFAKQMDQIKALREAEAQKAADEAEYNAISQRQARDTMLLNQRYAHETLDLNARQSGGKVAPALAHQNLLEHQQLAQRQLRDQQRLNDAAGVERQDVAERATNRTASSMATNAAADRALYTAEMTKTAESIKIAGAEKVDAIIRAAELEQRALTEAEKKTVTAIQTETMAKVSALYADGRAVSEAALATAGQKIFALDAAGAATAKAAETGLIAQAKGKIGGATAAAAGLLGEFVMPAIIALTVTEMVIKPIEQAIIDRAIKGDKQLQEIQANTSLVIQNRGPGFADNLSYADQQTSEATAKQNIQDTINQKKAELEQMKRESAQLFGPSGGPEVPGGRAIVSALGGMGLDPFGIGKATKEIAILEDSLKQVNGESEKTKLMPDAAISKSNDVLTSLLGDIDSGKKTVEEFTVAWLEDVAVIGGRAAELEKQGVAEQKAQNIVAGGIDLAKQHAKAVQDALETEKAAYREKLENAMQQAALGGSKDDVSVANFGKHLDQSDASKSEIAAAKKEIAELEAAWKKAQQTVDSIDISKGFDSFAKLADNIRLANQELARAGQSNPALQALGQMADAFKSVTDQEKLATQAMDGYNLTLQKSQGYLGELGKVQKEFDTALDLAVRRIAAGRGSDQDKFLVDNQKNIQGNLANQQETISEHMVLDVIGKVTNLTDFAQLDTYLKDVVAHEGGVTVYAKIETNQEEAKRQIDGILAPRHMTIILDTDFTQFDPAIAQRAKQYSDWYRQQGGNSPYDQRGASSGGSSGGSSPWSGQAPPFPGPGQAGQYAFGPDNPGGSLPGGGGSLGYRSLDWQSYDAIVKGGSRGSNSPLDDPEIYKAFIAAAQGNNVDPRLMLTATRYENGNATDIDPDLNRANNFGGLTYDGSPGQTRGPARPAAEGGYYQSFNSPQDFFDALAKNLSTGSYAQDFSQGDVKGIRKRYTPLATNQDLDNFDNTYQGYVKDYPGYRTGSGSGSGGGFGQGGVVTGAEGGGSGTDSAATGIRNAIVQKALSQVDQNKLAGYCEQWVEETIQSITGQRGATGRPERNASTAFSSGQGMGLEVSKAQAQPGDLVYYPDAAGGTGHVAIYMGGGMQVSTADGSGVGKEGLIHTESVGDGARYISTTSGGDGRQLSEHQESGQAYKSIANAPAGGFGPGSPYLRAPNINAALPPSQDPLMKAIYPESALPYLDKYGAGMSHMDARSQGEGRNFFNQLSPVMTDYYADKGLNGVTFGANRTSDPTKAQSEQISNNALQATLSLTTQVNVAIDAMNKGLAVTPEMYKKIADAAGPLAPLVTAQVAAMADLEANTQKLARLKDDQQAADTAYQKKVEDRTAANAQIQRGQTVTQWMRADDQLDITQARKKITDKEQDDDRYRARKNTLDQRDIEDARTAEQRRWQDEGRALQNQQRVRAEDQRQQDLADRNHKQSLDDAYQVLTRQEQDKVRIQNFRGGQESIALQDQRKYMDEQHRISTEGMQQNASLYVAAGKGASTEAEALANASQAAAINDARVKADELYRKQAEANTRAQDDLSKKHAQEMFDLETESLAAARKHEDELKAIDRAAQVRHDAYNQETYDLAVQQEKRQYGHEMTIRDEQDLDKQRKRSYEDQTFAIEDQRIQQKRVWEENDLARKKANTEEDRNFQIAQWRREDLAKQDDDKYKADKLANSQLQQQTQENITNDQKQLTGIKDVINEYGILLKKFGEAAVYASGILNTPIPSVTPTGGTSVLGAGGSGTIRNLKGFAIGTGFSPSGDAMVNERGGEMRTLLSGETILPADATKRMFDALTRGNNVSPISSAPSYREGDIHINIDGGGVTLSADAQSRIRALIQREIAEASPTTYLGRQAATGGMRR